uniref:Uncharacterized protein n=1 Tax=Paramormyrops kingsleyae TaxID=1676925 RepID=A0A3B3RZQ0_9TELE
MCFQSNLRQLHELQGALLRKNAKIFSMSAGTVSKSIEGGTSGRKSMPERRTLNRTVMKHHTSTISGKTVHRQPHKAGIYGNGWKPFVSQAQRRVSWPVQHRGSPPPPPPPKPGAILSLAKQNVAGFRYTAQQV